VLLLLLLLWPSLLLCCRRWHHRHFQWPNKTRQQLHIKNIIIIPGSNLFNWYSQIDALVMRVWLTVVWHSQSQHQSGMTLISSSQLEWNFPYWTNWWAIHTHTPKNQLKRTLQLLNLSENIKVNPTQHEDIGGISLYSATSTERETLLGSFPASLSRIQNNNNKEPAFHCWCHISLFLVGSRWTRALFLLSLAKPNLTTNLSNLSSTPSINVNATSIKHQIGL
jgi:hypothetical protein